MSHSGSRALGYTVANYFTKLASKVNPLPAPLNELSWLSMDTQEGKDYWDLMELCGEYSAANHRIIHASVLADAGVQPKSSISNHHNFAWKELVDGKELLVHRKGATPAGHGVYGIIPSSMATKAYVVRGKGSADGIYSASHGSGRVMSRSQAFKNIKKESVDAMLAQNGVELLSAGLDESPQAYKDINVVMEAQTELVEVVASFQPRIVRMAGSMEADKSEGQ
jgi:tRNA-splicing ligase RtcB